MERGDQEHDETAGERRQERELRKEALFTKKDVK
jgi:hypothetical protein